MKIRRPRSVGAPLVVTGLVLLALVFRFARFDERIVVRITSPPGPYPLKLKAGAVVSIEATVDSGDATYGVATGVYPNFVAKGEGGERDAYGCLSIGNYDPATGKFAGTVTVPYVGGREGLFLGLDVIDQAGRRHEADPGAPDGSLIPVVIE